MGSARRGGAGGAVGGAARGRWAEPRRLLGAHPAAARRTAFMLVRPEAVRQGQVPDIVAWLGERGFGVTALKVVRPHHCRLEELYRYTQVRLMDAGGRPLWWYMPRYYRFGPAVALLLDRPGDRVALRAQGAFQPGPVGARPAAVRIRLAEHGDVRRPHVRPAGDGGAGVLPLSRQRRGGSVLRGADGGTRRDLAPAEVVDRLVAGGGPTRAVRLPNFHQVLAGLQARIVRRSASPTSDWAARSLEQLALGSRLWPSYGGTA